MTAEVKSFLPYHEPGIVTILIQSSFILILNVVNTLFDKFIFCGLLGQVFIGVAWGTPGAKWLGQGVEDVIVQLGYLGLILLVYQGGLDTNFRSLKANLSLSVAVAITGISFPMALSFVLQSLVDATPIQAFAAGAALCSTSLGTTFTILNVSGLSTTRLGTVLSSAAMMDDVVGLVMVQVISNIGETANSFSAVTVVRPLAVSFGLAIVVPLACRLVAQPLTTWLNSARKSSPNGALNKLCQATHTAFIIHTLVLAALVTGATYAGTSNLFAAYLAGASISWWDSEVPHLDSAKVGCSPESPSSPVEHGTSAGGTGSPNPSSRDEVSPGTEGEAAEGTTILKEQSDTITNSGIAVYHRYYATAVRRVLQPFFFVEPTASIGFAIPITDMFSGSVVWRGIVYTILMLFAKLVTGLWLVRLDISLTRIIPKSIRSSIFGGAKAKKEVGSTASAADTHELQPRADAAARPPTEENPTTKTQRPAPGSVASAVAPPKAKNPRSLYPAAMLGTAMTARGEIGFLIASIAETTGLFASSSRPGNGSSEIYLVVTWAIVLCTIIGPLGVGTLVKRVRRLQGERAKTPGASDPLGIWGVS
ncbi:hypothetical protein VF21_00135 [Pseudogymnoascus sp. 05NY08]|nr:hypothetical protein VF21_00160 [Pseudogymnoascus sp. 05NY08]OBT81034.1 hypothetical protein VF21_00135 [Pseudogymnoascus sp. 05NY08]